MKRMVVFLLLFTCILFGCVNTSIIDELQLVTSIGMDYFSEEEVEITAGTPIYNKDENVTNSSLSAISGTNRGVRTLLNTRTPAPISIGKILVVLVEEKLTTQFGMASILDSLSRDPSFGTRHKIAIAPSQTKDFYSIEFPYDMDIATYINEEIEHNEKQQKIPRSNAHLFFKQYYQVGQDPFLPYIKMHDDSQVEVAGLALFKGDRFIHKINLDDSYTLKILYERFNNGSYEVALKGKGNYANIRNVESKPSYKIEKNTNRPTIHIHIDLKGALVEYIGKNSADHRLKEIKEALNKKIESDAKRVVSLLQDREIDPLGIGSRVQGLNYQFDVDEWEDYYPEADIKITANVEIVATGVLD